MFVNWYFSGFKDVAEYFLGKFKWGSSFTSLNQELLDKYAACKTSLEVVAVQNEYLETARQEKIDRLSKFTIIYSLQLSLLFMYLVLVELPFYSRPHYLKFQETGVFFFEL